MTTQPNDYREEAHGGVCALCGFGVTPDDASLPAEGGKVICVRCLAHRAKDDHPMPKSLRQQVERIVNEVT